MNKILPECYRTQRIGQKTNSSLAYDKVNDITLKLNTFQKSFILDALSLELSQYQKAGLKDMKKKQFHF